MSAFLTFVLALIISWGMSFTTSAQAGWFGKKDAHKAEFTEPPAQTLEDECGELRRKIGAINSSGAFRKTLNIPRREWLLRQNKQCMAEWGQQEFDYLRNADVQPQQKQVLGPESSPNPTEENE